MATIEERRLAFHEELCNALELQNVYFQPPTNVRLEYPCVVYSRRDMPKWYADNLGYISSLVYDVTLIYKNPDSELPGKLIQMPKAYFDRHFVNENLYHDNFVVYR